MITFPYPVRSTDQLIRSIHSVVSNFIITEDYLFYFSDFRSCIAQKQDEDGLDLQKNDAFILGKIKNVRITD